MTDYSEELSDKFLQKVILSRKPLYEIGANVGLSPPDMSRLLRKYPRRWSDKSWKMMIERVGLIVGLREKECWR